LIDRFVAEDPAARAAAARRLEIDPALAARWEHALKREYAARGIDPDLELRGSAAIAHDVCRQIAVCAEYLSLTVRELDGFLKRSALPVELARVEVAACLDEALALLGPRLESADARVERRLEGEGKLAVLADRRLLVHALVNLLKNAVEATLAAGIAPRFLLSATVEGASVLIGVADNGPGIPEADLRRVFEVGFSTKGPGRGRGLAIVRESVHVQGGAIRVRRLPEGGTEFVIELPAAKETTNGNVNSEGSVRKKT
jgi:C4-dicarboxylate-specific signal transduction histidine kinase